MKALYIVALTVQIISTSEYLKCVNTKLNEISTQRQIAQIKPLLHTANSNIQQSQRILETINGLNVERNRYTVESEGNSGKVKHRYCFKITKVNVIDYLMQNDKQKDYDRFWVQQICKPNLMNLYYVSEVVAKYFCYRVCKREVLGDLIDYKFGRYNEIGNLFSLAFDGYKETFSTKQYLESCFEVENKDQALNGNQEEDLRKSLTDIVNEVFKDLMVAVPVFKNKLKNLLKDKIYDFSKFPNIQSNRIELSQVKTNHFLNFMFTKLNGFNIQDWNSFIDESHIQNLTDDKIPIYQSYVNYIIRMSDQANNPMYLENVRYSLAVSCFKTLANIEANEINRSYNVLIKCNKTVAELFSRIKKVTGDISYLESNFRLIDQIRDRLKLRLFTVFGGKDYLKTASDQRKYRYSELKIEEFVDLVLGPFNQDFLPLIEQFNHNLTNLRHNTDKNKLPKDVLLFLVNWYNYYCEDGYLQSKFINDINHKSGDNLSKRLNITEFINLHNEIENLAPKTVYCPDSGYQITNQTIFKDKLRNGLLKIYPSDLEIINTVVNKVNIENDGKLDFSNSFVELLVKDVVKKIKAVDFNKTDMSTLEDILPKIISKQIKSIDQGVNSILSQFKSKEKENLEVTDNSKEVVTNFLLNKISDAQGEEIEQTNITEENTKELEEIFVNLKMYYNNGKDYTEIEDIDIFSEFGILDEEDPNKGKSSDVLDLVDKLESDNVNKPLPDTIKSDIKFLLKHFSKLPDDIKFALEKCHNINPLKESAYEVCSSRNGDPERCNAVAPGLVVDKCNGHYNKLTGKCSFTCPSNFKYDSNGYCLKPLAYTINDYEEKCQNNYRMMENWCMPVCPLGWFDSGVSCKIPAIKDIEDYFVKDLTD